MAWPLACAAGPWIGDMGRPHHHAHRRHAGRAAEQQQRRTVLKSWSGMRKGWHGDGAAWRTATDAAGLAHVCCSPLSRVEQHGCGWCCTRIAAMAALERKQMACRAIVQASL